MDVKKEDFICIQPPNKIVFQCFHFHSMPNLKKKLPKRQHTLPSKLKDYSADEPRELLRDDGKPVWLNSYEVNPFRFGAYLIRIQT